MDAKRFLAEMVDALSPAGPGHLCHCGSMADAVKVAEGLFPKQDCPVWALQVAEAFALLAEQRMIDRGLEKDRLIYVIDRMNDAVEKHLGPDK